MDIAGLVCSGIVSIRILLLHTIAATSSLNASNHKKSTATCPFEILHDIDSEVVRPAFQRTAPAFDARLPMHVTYQSRIASPLSIFGQILDCKENNIFNILFRPSLARIIFQADSNMSTFSTIIVSSSLPSLLF